MIKENPKIGEWWMCQSINTKRMCPMVKVKNGWGSICNSEGKALQDFIQREPIFKPLYKMSKTPLINGNSEASMKLRVWHIPQIPMKKFIVDVDSIEESVKVMKILADYDAFQLEHNVKPEYSNAQGVNMFDPEDKEDGPSGSWVSWCDEETGEDNPKEWLKYQ